MDTNLRSDADLATLKRPEDAARDLTRAIVAELGELAALREKAAAA